MTSLTVADLMDDRVLLDGVLMKCNEDPAKARNSSDCLNARVAVERLADTTESQERAKRNAEFERNRERLRLAQERARQEQEAQSKVDPYSLPVVPVDSPPRPAPTAAPGPESGPAPPLATAGAANPLVH